jgi:hypothetical protein
MIARGFMEPSVSELWWTKKQINEIKDLINVENCLIEDASLSCTQALQTMKAKHVDSLFYFEDG